MKRWCSRWVRLVWGGLALAGAIHAQAAEQNNPALVRSRRITSAGAALARQQTTPVVGEERVYAFFPDAAYTVTVARVEQGYGNTTLITSQVNDGREVTCLSVIAPDGERLTVRDRSRARLYQCVSVAAGGWEYREYDLAKELPRTPLPPRTPPGLVPRPATEAIRLAGVPTTTQAQEPVQPMATTFIDVMVVYDTTAQAWVTNNGGMAAFAADTVARMNLAMTTTGIDCTFRLVHTVGKAYTYNTAGDLGAPLDAITYGTGVFSDLDAIRTAYCADLVTILVDTGSAYGYVGQGWLLNYTSGTPGYAFTACSIQSVAQGHTLTHEVGHNLGCGHATNQLYDPGPASLYAYASGYYFTANSTKRYTIMAYNDDGYGNFYYDTDYFSTPLKTYKTSGVVVGNASTADNARVIRNTMTVVSNYKTLSAPGVPANMTATDGTLTTETTVAWTAVLGASYYTIWRGTTTASGSASQIGTSAVATYSDQTATPGALYYYWVKAVNEAGSSGFSIRNSGYRALAAPAGFSAAGGMLTSGVTANWTSVTGASHYQVYRATSAAGSKTTLGSWQTGLSYNDTSAAAGLPYYYFARAAVDASGLRPSAYSAYDTGFWLTALPTIANGGITNGIIGSAFQVGFEGVAGISYHILYKDALTNAAWTTNMTVMPAANGPQSIPVEITPGKTQGFYRLEMAP